MEQTWMAWFIRRFEPHTGFIFKLKQQHIIIIIKT